MDNNIDNQTNSNIGTSAPAPFSNSIIDTPISPENPTGDINQPPKKKSKAGLIIGIIIGVLVLAGGIVAAIFVINYNQRLAWHRETAEQLLEAISSSTNEKSVFFAKDFAELSDRPANSPYSTYDDRSYVAKYDDNIYLCLNNDDTKISGQRDNLTISGMNNEESCHYNFKDGEREAYLYNYINRKYGYAVDKSKTSIEREDTYLITTDKGVIYASLALNSGEIRVIDDHESLTTDYSDTNNLSKLVGQRTLTFLNSNSLEGAAIYDVNAAKNTSNNLVMVKSTYTLSEAKRYLEYISEFLKGKPVTSAIVAVTRYREAPTQTDPYALSTDYAVGLYIGKAGEHHIIVVEEDKEVSEQP